MDAVKNHDDTQKWVATLRVWRKFNSRQHEVMWLRVRYGFHAARIARILEVSPMTISRDIDHINKVLKRCYGNNSAQVFKKQ
jgi:DNA-directed RNA polymerase specialized sigma subunit